MHICWMVRREVWILLGRSVDNNKNNNATKIPLSLRSNIIVETGEGIAARKATVVGLIAVASIGSAEAQQQQLPPVSVEAPVARPKPAASKPTAEQIRVRNAIRLGPSASSRPRKARRRSLTRTPPSRPPIVIRTPILRRPTRSIA